MAGPEQRQQQQTWTVTGSSATAAAGPSRRSSPPLLFFCLVMRALPDFRFPRHSGAESSLVVAALRVLCMREPEGCLPAATGPSAEWEP
mmetsp:Transcript_160085/g.282270  ORF Transcript_160085/g.282270 Transcript_160085/m.282270 type:complete len:89 (+) Transcript_160085:1487-1753(+)